MNTTTSQHMMIRILFSVLIAFAFGIGCNVGDQTTVVEQTECPGQQTFCAAEAACFDLSVSETACGACGNACAEGESCIEGTCGVVCPAGFVACDGTCVNPLTDAAYCGAGQGCTDAVACPAGELCSEGACGSVCAAGTIECDGTCIDPDVDANYCGAEGNCTGQNAGDACAPTEFCDRGACVSGCTNGTVPCDGGCIDPDDSPRFCGATAQCTGASAGVMCAPGEVCNAGTCEIVCGPDRIQCGGECVEPLTDPRFCGATDSCDAAAGTAGAICSGNSLCFAGECFEQTATFISPANTRGAATFRRDTVYILDSFIPTATLLYTLDGSDPERGGATTMTAQPPFVTPPLTNDQVIRFRLDYAGRLSDIENMTHRTADPAVGATMIVEEMRLNGGGPIARVAPGESIQMTYNLEAWDTDESRQLVHTIYDPNYDLIRCEVTSETAPNMTTSFTDTYVAPMEPGTYYLRFVHETAADCMSVPPRERGGGLAAVVIVE